MRRAVAWLLAAACLAGAARAAEEEEAPMRVRRHLWKAPFYAVLGLPRDLIDAPAKALSSIPVFNLVFCPPLLILNTATTLACWSFTQDGIEGGFEAWIACEGMARKKGKHTPEFVQDRPSWKNYFPNFRSFRILTREPAPPPKEHPRSKVSK